MARTDGSRASGWVGLRGWRGMPLWSVVLTGTPGPPEGQGGSLTRTTAPVRATVIRFHRCESRPVSQGAYMVAVPYEEGGDAGGLD